MELLLLVFFCLLTGSEVTFGAGTTVIRVKEGKDVTLPCSLREDITNKKFVWKKDGRQVFLYDDGDHSNNAGTGQDQLFRGRVSYFLDELKSGDASITIRNMTVAETGLYTCEFPDLQPSQIFHIVLVGDRATEDAVKDAAKDKLINETTEITVKEGRNVILPCSLNTKEDITNKKFVWKKNPQKQVFHYYTGNHSNNVGTGQDQQFRGRVENFPDKLKSGDASITISNMKVADRGLYTCEFPDLQPRQTFLIQLYVDRATADPDKVRDEINKGLTDGAIAGLVISVLVVVLVVIVGGVLKKMGYTIQKCKKEPAAPTAPTAPTALTTPTAPTPPGPAAPTALNPPAQDGNGTDGGDVEASVPLMPLNGNQTPNEESRF